ncbi:hypothetical protein [Paenibacillus sp. N3.4]|uniref:hypothetical protein n=1 Tax=Paenibacillus sp. N3.4 TaxID=2603222 RepID=UPI0011CA0D87|nr:hypothetical protein [Paenibacillus sp. N3.4]TXK74445.1 hypothetical protein FU659_29480 [Paenibacillus sp. N3.4]
MRKYIIGFLVGAIVTAAGTAYADEIASIVGKKIEGQFPVKIAGKSLTTQAVVLEGTSYLPVRAIGEALNMDVMFNADLGIELKEKAAASLPAQPLKSVQDQIDELNKRIDGDKHLIAFNKSVVIANSNLLKESTVPKEDIQKVIIEMNNQISESEKRIADFEAQIAALQNSSDPTIILKGQIDVLSHEIESHKSISMTMTPVSLNIVRLVHCYLTKKKN